MRLFDLLPFPWPGIRVCDIEISHMGKNYGNPDLMHVKKDSSFTGSYLYTTLKDFKTQKNRIHSNVSLLLRFGNNENQYVSKTFLNFIIFIKIINNVRARVYQIAIHLDSEVAIRNLSRNWT